MTKNSLKAALEAIPGIPDNAPVAGFNSSSLTKAQFQAWLDNPQLPGDVEILTTNDGMTAIVPVTGVVFGSGIVTVHK